MRKLRAVAMNHFLLFIISLNQTVVFWVVLSVLIQNAYQAIKLIGIGNVQA
jgi:hypothetical protein